MTHLTRSDLIARGWTDGRIARAVRSGALTRIRAGHFTDGDLDQPTQDAIRIGGRLACVSELRRRGIWVLDRGELHIHLAPHASRLRAGDRPSRGHWRPLTEALDRDPDHVGVVDALLQASRCLDRREWVASADSALHLGVLGQSQLDSVASRLHGPARRWVDLVDGRAESGLESIVRTLAVDLGFRVRSQVRVRGVGRVDLLVEDRVVIEVDGSAFHDLALSSRDRRRDALLFALGYVVVRPGYALVVFDREAVARQLISAVAKHRDVQDSGRLARRALRRLENGGLA